MHFDYKVISVESRKGGVGKTTAAINLASLLYERDYNVFLIDLDITGTSISHACHSPFWKDMLHLVTINNKEVNFIKEFSENYLCGNDSASFTYNPKDTKKLFVKSDKINVLSSNLYNSEGVTLCDPRIIFDELHSYWLTEHIKTLCDSFFELFKKKTIVILDNSPGFVGLAKSIHEWLTDLGPDRGKFLTISSLDIQDIHSCLSAIRSIDKIIDHKYRGSKYFENLKSSTIEFPEEPDKEAISFFLKLSNEEFEDSTLSYWLKKSRKPDIFEYQSLIINKAPKELRSNMFYFNTSELFIDDMDRSISNFISGLSNFNSEKRLNNIVFYDDFISNQFIEKYIKKSLSKKQKTIQRNTWLKGFFTKLENELSKNEAAIHKNSPNDFYDIIDLYDRNITLIIKHLKEIGYSNITRLIDEEWYPKAPFDKVQHLFDNLSDYIFLLNIYPRSRLRFDYSDSDYSFFINLFSNLSSSNYLSPYHNKLSKDDRILNSYKYLWYYLLAPFISSNHNEKRFSSLLSLINIVSEIQNKRYLTFSINEKSKNIKVFLASDSLNYNHLNTFIKANLTNNNDINNLEYIENMFRFSFVDDDMRAALFADFYNSFCRAQARIIDIDTDYEFLLFVLKNTTVSDESNDSNIYPNIRSLLNSVIVEKTLSHALAKDKFQEEIFSAKKMIEFKQVLEQCLIKQWNL
ncbi:MAG TPA: hypothetical protein DEO54_07840 [Rikenellaceae bacterium]|nr:MAG: hypothetical protein A2X20_02235 [Bacteroidetes bacterium GWE2_40_15]HBZ26136.1 hypothetical protein [Rikenellaceae bacterium]